MRERFDSAVQDVRYALRGLARRPGFTVVAILTLAVGIGANTAIYSAVDALLLRSLPYREPSRLMDVALRDAEGEPSPWSYPKYLVFRDAQRSYSSLALNTELQATLTGANPERVGLEEVGARYLSILGVRVALGRDFPAELDAGPGARKFALISDALWQRRFGADEKVVGRTIDIDGAPYEIAGVLPPGFKGLSGKADAITPLTSRAASGLNEAWSLEFSLVGRLKDGVPPQRAEEEAARLGKTVYDAFPMGQGSLTTSKSTAWGAIARPLDTIRVASALRRSLLVLFGAVGMVLLVACVNLANLLLGRANARRQEIAIRRAVGASRGRLIRLLLTESCTLALLGGVASVAVAWWATRLLSAMNPRDTLRAQGLDGALGAVGFDSIRLDGRALAFTFLVAVTVGVLFGIIPALQATRKELTQELKDPRASAGPRWRRGVSRRALVVAEVSLALILLVGSGLMVRSLRNLLNVDAGFDARDVLTLRLTIPPGVAAPDSLAGFYAELQSAIAALPGVRQVALADCPPLNGGCNGTIMTFPDRTQSITGNAMTGVHWVSPDWFATMRVPLKRGRLFTVDDRANAPRVVLINEEAARRYFPGEDPLGKRVKVYQGGFDAGATVVGIVGDVRYGTVDSTARADTYISYGQSRLQRMMIFVRTDRDPVALAPAIRAAIKRLAPLDPVYDIKPMSERVGAATAQARFSAILLALFATAALALAAIGIYGVMSFNVAQRTREIGIRMALGAEVSNVLWLVIGEGAWMAGLGVLVGIAGALAATRVLRTMLFGIAPTDLATYGSIVVIVAGAALVASWIPARNAARVEPSVALRRG